MNVFGISYEEKYPLFQDLGHRVLLQIYSFLSDIMDERGVIPSLTLHPTGNLYQRPFGYAWYRPGSNQSDARLVRTILFRNQRPNVIGLYTMRSGDRIYLWNGKVGVNAQTLPFPFALKLLHNSKVCMQASLGGLVSLIALTWDISSPKRASPPLM